MLRYYVKKSYNEEPQEVKTPSAEHVWVYGSEVTADELTYLADEYHIDNGVLRDVLDKHELPRVEYTAGCFMYSYEPRIQPLQVVGCHRCRFFR